MNVSFTKLVQGVFLMLVIIAALFPIAWMALSSFKPENEIYRVPPTWIPEHLTLDNYRQLFTHFGFARLTWNSILISAAVVVLSVVLGVMASYGFSRYKFRGSNFLLTALLAVRMITPSAIVVPLYLLMKALGQLNTLSSIIVGITVLNLPFVVWIMTPFFDALPREYEEAALLDGLTPTGVFWRIAMPLSKPGLFTVILFSFIAGWVDLLFGMSFAMTERAMPLTVGLMMMQTGYKIYWGPMMAGGIYLTLPTFILSFGLQRYLVQGMRVSF